MVYSLSGAPCWLQAGSRIGGQSAGSNIRLTNMAGLLKFGKLHHSQERYSASFRALMAVVETRKDMYQMSYEANIPDCTLCEPGADLRVLGIGSGSGETDSAILKKLLQRHSSVYNRVVEPSGEMIGRYKTAEEYFQTKDDTKFHLIHAVHVLYYVEDLDATLRNLWEQLGDGGYMLVAIQSDKGGWGGLRHKLWEKFGQGDRVMTWCSTSGDVKQCLDTRGISYVTSVDEININVSECFKDDSEAGKLLLDFLTHTPYVSSEPEIKSTALEYIRGLLKLGKLMHHSPGWYSVNFRAFLAALEMSKDMYQMYGPKVPDLTLCELGADLRVLGIGSGSERYSESFRALIAAVETSRYQMSYGPKVPDSTLCEPGTDLRVLGIGSGSGKGDWGGLRHKLWEKFGQGDRDRCSTSDDVKQCLDRRGISYVTSFDTTNINVSECFKENSENGKLLLDFLTHTPYVSSEPEIKSTALQYIRGRVPVLGHLLALGRAPHLELTAWRRQYGDVFTIRLGMEDIVVLNGYTAVKDALVDRSELFASRPQSYLLDSTVGFEKADVDCLEVPLDDLSIVHLRATSASLTPAEIVRNLRLFCIRSTHSQAQEELDAVVGESLPTLSHRSQLPYVNACLLEVMRIRTLIPVTIHATTQDVEVQGYDIPKGSRNMGVCMREGGGYTCDCTRTGYYGQTRTAKYCNSHHIYISSVKSYEMHQADRCMSLSCTAELLTALGAALKPSDEMIDHLLFNYKWLWHIINNTQSLRNFLMRLLSKLSVGQVDSPPLYHTGHDYTSWDTYSARSYYTRALPPVPADCPTPMGTKGPKELPSPEYLAETFLARRTFLPDTRRRTNVLFGFMAQHFTHQFFKTDFKKGPGHTWSDHAVDMSHVYGETTERQHQLRSFQDGKLKYQLVDGEVFPPSLQDAPVHMIYPPNVPEDKRFALGHEFFGHLPGLFVWATVWLREHNRVCDVMKKVHPDWDDERLFQTARLILIGETIKIVIEEYVQHLAGNNFQLVWDPELLFEERLQYQNRISVEFNHLYHWHMLMPDHFDINGTMYTMEDYLFNNDIVLKHGLNATVDAMSRQIAGRVSATYLGHCIYNIIRAPGDAEMAAQLEEAYGDIDAVELYVGWAMENPMPAGNVLSEMFVRMGSTFSFTGMLSNPICSPGWWKPSTFGGEVGFNLLKTTTLKDLFCRNMNGPCGLVSFSVPEDVEPTGMPEAVEPAGLPEAEEPTGLPTDEGASQDKHTSQNQEL
uniref:Uncharacterized protein n=1 Tax=Branchiostoma floridae TaxID=7739 RepID=C3XRN1_BRAFL|eukprot:XP_002613340.1 hypothetical protein BRAFLDRAFT_68307 [Branchiostoma floridae]